MGRMNEHNDHIIHYSAADIQRYVQGNMSAHEMHAIEKAALDDPFLADAIEGIQEALQQHDATVITGQLQDLQQQLTNRIGRADDTKTARVVPFRWWQMAAAAVVLIVAGVWIYNLYNSRAAQNSPLAQVTAKKSATKQEEKAAAPAPPVENKAISVQADSTVPASSYGYATTDRAVAAHKKKKEVVKQRPSTATYNASAFPHDRTDSVHYYGFGAAAAKPAAKEETADQQQVTTAARAPEAAKAKKNDSAVAYAETELITFPKKAAPSKAQPTFDNKNLSGFVKGRVTDQNNNPIANAYLQIPNYNNNFITDKSGYFKIPVSDTAVDVSINVAGYAKQNVRLQNNVAMNQIQLQPVNSMYRDRAAIGAARKTVLAKKLAEDRKKYPNIVIQDAEPVFGWVAYDQYLEKNKKIPAGNEHLTGDVVVSFEVNRRGNLSHFNIVQSLAKAYDEEALRLIKQGPAFKLLKGHKARITVIVRF